MRDAHTTTLDSLQKLGYSPREIDATFRERNLMDSIPTTEGRNEEIYEVYKQQSRRQLLREKSQLATMDSSREPASSN